MKIGNQLKFGSAILVLLLGITISCTRSLSIPVSPSFTQTTPTNTATNTSVNTSTPTNSPTNTASFTPTNTPQFTNTPTNTPTNTCTATATNTFQFSPTNTPTATVSDTPTNTLSPTNTATNTATSTPTVNPNIIADFEEGGLQDVTTNGLGLSGYWYPVTDVSSTAMTALVSTGATGCATGSYVSIGGTTGPTGNVYAQLQGDFVNPTGAYNIPGSYNAFVFCIKSSTLTQVLFQVSDAATTQSSANAQVMVPVSSSWTSVTVCFNHMQSPSWAPCSIQGHMFDPTNAISASWQVNTTSTAYDIELDNFQFLSGGTCPAFTATPNPNYPLIDDFEQTGGSPKDSGNLYVATDQNGKVRDGGWFDFTDSGSTAVTNFASSPAQSGTYAAEFSGTLNSTGSYAGFGFNFTNPSSCPNNGVTVYDATVGGLYTGIVFYAETKSMSATNCTGVQPVVVDLVDNSPVSDHSLAIPVTAAYQPYTIFYNQCLNSAGVTVDPAHLQQVVFKPQGNGNPGYNYDFMVDNIQFTSAPAPAAATPVPNSVVDNFQNGSNQIQFPYAASIGVTAGYWFDYTDSSSAPNLCPKYISGAASEPGFFLGAPGNTTVVQGVPSFCASLYASSMDLGSPSYGYGGMGFAFNNSGTLDISGGGQWTHLVFYVKSTLSSGYIVMLNDTNTNGDGCYGPSINFYPYNTSFGSATATTSWAPVTISFISTAGDYNLGLPTIVLTSPATNGCNKTVNGGNPYAFDYTTAMQIQWQAQGSAAGPYDLEVGNIFLY